MVGVDDLKEAEEGEGKEKEAKRSLLSGIFMHFHAFGVNNKPLYLN
jgi:hypothetical protein